MLLLGNLLQTAAVPDVIRGAVMVIFFICAVLVILVVLAQEGKGGGLAGAFGGAGAETFGVKAGTVNKFTAWLAAAFLGLALLHAGLGSFTKAPPDAPDVTGLGADSDDGKKEPAEDPNQPPGAVDPDKKDAPKKDGDGKDDGEKKGAPKKDDGEKKPGDTEPDDDENKKDD